MSPRRGCGRIVCLFVCVVHVLLEIDLLHGWVMVLGLGFHMYSGNSSGFPNQQTGIRNTEKDLTT